MKTVQFYTENGGVSAKTRKTIQVATVNQLRDGSVSELLEPTDKDNILVAPVAETERGETIYSIVEVKVSTLHPNDRAKRKSKAKETDTEEESFVIE
jgi:hypothetical protein